MSDDELARKVAYQVGVESYATYPGHGSKCVSDAFAAVRAEAIAAKDAEIARWERDYQERDHNFQRTVRELAGEIERLRKALTNARSYVQHEIECGECWETDKRVLAEIDAALGSPAPVAGQ